MDSPVPIIIGVNSEAKEFKFNLSFTDINNKFVIYNIEDDILEISNIKIFLPSFNNNIWKLEKSYN